MVYGLWFMVYGLWFMVYGLGFGVEGLDPRKLAVEQTLAPKRGVEVLWAG